MDRKKCFCAALLKKIYNYFLGCFTDLSKEPYDHKNVLLDMFLYKPHSLPNYDEDHQPANDILLRFPEVVREVAMCHLSFLNNIHSVNDAIIFLDIIDMVKQNGVKIIWDDIKIEVKRRMLEEFGSWDIHEDDDSFIKLIGSGEYIYLDNQHLNTFIDAIKDAKSKSLDPCMLSSELENNHLNRK